MDVEVIIGDVLDHPADVLISPANPWLNMSGGVNGEILARGGESIQDELRDYLRSIGKRALEAGSVVRSSAGPLPFKHIIHAVAIDPFYESDASLVRKTLESAFELARSLGAQTLSMPTLATGYGRLPMESFAEAFAPVTKIDWSTLKLVRVVVRSEENVVIVRNGLQDLC